MHKAGSLLGLGMQDGFWDKERILPEGWVKYSTAPTPANPLYGAGWWLGPGLMNVTGSHTRDLAFPPSFHIQPQAQCSDWNKGTFPSAQRTMEIAQCFPFIGLLLDLCPAIS